MAYQQLGVYSIPKYLSGIPEMGKKSNFNHLKVRGIGDGNLNFVYLITNQENPRESAALKQSVPYLRIIAESRPLPKERMSIEIRALQKAKEWCPQHVPDIYYSSHDMCLVVMQDLSAHGVLRSQMIEGKVFPKLADHVSTNLAETLFHTSDLYLDNREKKELLGAFINIELCKITEDFVFTHPYGRNETNVYNPELNEADLNFIHQDCDLKISVADMKRKFMTEAQAWSMETCIPAALWPTWTRPTYSIRNFPFSDQWVLTSGRNWGMFSCLFFHMNTDKFCWVGNLTVIASGCWTLLRVSGTVSRKN